jgi:hypothetical protein
MNSKRLIEDPRAAFKALSNVTHDSENNFKDTILKKLIMILTALLLTLPSALHQLYYPSPSICLKKKVIKNKRLARGNFAWLNQSVWHLSLFFRSSALLGTNLSEMGYN